MGCRVVVSMFLVAFRNDQREDKHGIYYVGHTFPTLVKGHVFYSIWLHVGAPLGALGPICVPKCLLGSVLEK